jgi:hypothetical protein
MNKENNDMATRMLERDEQQRAKFAERKAHMEANNERIKTPDGWKPPKRCDSVALTTDDGKRHTAFICDAKHQPNDWGTDYPSFALTCRLVWGKCDAADFTLSIDTEMLSPRTAKLCPWHISEISLPKWNVVFSDGSIIDMKYCRLTPITDMQTIRDNANVQRIIEEHFSGTPKKLTLAERKARADGGKAKAQLADSQIKVIVAESAFIKNQSQRRKGELIAERCLSGRWTHNKALERLKITRRDGKPITGRYIRDVIKNYKLLHG